MAIDLLSPLPDPPLPTDAEDVFDAKAGATLTAQQKMVNVDINGKLVPQINAATAQITTDKNAAAQSATDAAVAADRAEAVDTNVSEQVAAAKASADNAAAAAAAAGQGAGFPQDGSVGDVLMLADGGQVAWGSMPAVAAPSNVSPAAGLTNVSSISNFVGSAFYSLYGKVQASRQARMSLTADFSALVWDSGEIAGASTSVVAPTLEGLIPLSTQAHWQIRYKDADGAWSPWSSATSFTTAASYNNYIPTPTATPANFGDAFEGGFYTGMVWNQIAQAANSKLLATGSQVFTVPDMTNAPIVYAGQTLEVRSRANPANKFIGTVTGAKGTALTLNVTSIGGSGTFSDWSVVSRFRVIAAPKSSGENAGIALKNANTALPTASQTLTEGWLSTEAMRVAGDSTAYPAAYWARGLNIGGRTDWYIPARDELELGWRNLKPTTDSNYVTADRPTAASYVYGNNGSYGDVAATHGTNNNSAPVGAAYTAGVPAQTVAAAFRTGGAEAFTYGSSYYWSSSDYSASFAWGQLWDSSYPGYQSYNGKTAAFRVRAVRRSII